MGLHLRLRFELKFWAYLAWEDRKSTRLNSSHLVISYAVFCLKKKKKIAELWKHDLASVKSSLALTHAYDRRLRLIEPRVHIPQSAELLASYTVLAHRMHEDHR